MPPLVELLEANDNQEGFSQQYGATVTRENIAFFGEGFDQRVISRTLYS